MNTYMLECKLDEMERRLNRRLDDLEQRLKRLANDTHYLYVDTQAIRKELEGVEELAKKARVWSG